MTTDETSPEADRPLASPDAALDTEPPAMPGATSPAAYDDRAALSGVVLAITSILALAAIVAVFVRTAKGQELDQRAADGMGTSYHTDRLLSSGLNVVSVGAIVVALAVLLLFGLVRRRIDAAAGAALLVAGANVTTQLLKYVVITRPDLGLGLDDENTLPSGHVTVITSVLLAGALVIGSRARWLVVPLVTFGGVCAGVGVIVLGWHRPSDVAAAYAVVLGWSGIVVAVLALAGLRREGAPRGRGRVLAYAGGAALAVGVVGMLILAAGVESVWGRRELVLSIGAMALLALTCAGVVSLASYAFDLLGDGRRVRAPSHGPGVAPGTAPGVAPGRDADPR